MYRPGKETKTMRFMMIVKASADSEAGVLPSKELVAAMGRYNEELAKAGVLLAADGLHASSKGARVAFSGGRPTVTDGPFAETKELIAGFWIIQAQSLDEAVEWASRVPFEEGEIEVRQVFEPTDFPADVLPPEDAAREQALRQTLGR
ncbi:YciI family protein [Streptantibioticus rubrisoli]|uniref:YciI family protein n=1 Tax=Streptantibioticus rubrisoli TaxID=1387313 RepID=A0ABT1P767_9ACTN|nr:YciI family protein [Streptantibioticus rubrisoli]MCQ4041227.1 YciI family protein [Streptantibioticus rubrisoli]